MELTDVQKKAVGEWVREGCSLFDIQKRLSEQFAVSMTYMDVRFLVIDLGLKVKDKTQVSPASPLAGLGRGEGGDLRNAVGPDDSMSGTRTGVSVSVDKVIKPGTVVSGAVTFSDGTSARWFIDELGRLAIEAKQPGDKPSMEDLQAFQQEIGKELRRRGF